MARVALNLFEMAFFFEEKFLKSLISMYTRLRWRLTSEKRFYLTELIFQRLTKKFSELHCDRCGELLKVGDLIVSRHNAHALRRKFCPSAAPACWESMFIE